LFILLDSIIHFFLFKCSIKLASFEEETNRKIKEAPLTRAEMQYPYDKYEEEEITKVQIRELQGGKMGLGSDL